MSDKAAKNNVLCQSGKNRGDDLPELVVDVVVDVVGEVVVVINVDVIGQLGVSSVRRVLKVELVSVFIVRLMVALIVFTFCFLNKLLIWQKLVFDSGSGFEDGDDGQDGQNDSGRRLHSSAALLLDGVVPELEQKKRKCNFLLRSGFLLQDGIEVESGFLHGSRSRFYKQRREP